MRLGYFVPEFPGQTHAFFWREVRELERRGVEVEFVSTRRPKNGRGRARHEWTEDAASRTKYLVDGAAKRLITDWSSVRRGAALLRASDEPAGRFESITSGTAAAALAELSTQRQWDHIHVHSCGRAADVARLAGMLSGVPYSVVLHIDLPVYGPRQNEKWGDAAFGVCVTRTLRKQLLGYLPADCVPPLSVAPMGVELATFERTNEYTPWKGIGPLRLFSCGRLHPCKGHDDLIRAVKLLRDRGIPAELTVAGGSDGRHPEYLDFCSRLAGDLGVSDWIDFRGSISEQEVATGLHGSHIFTLASRSESIGVATMEAMASGLPVVVTGCPGVDELVRTGTDGVLVPLDEPPTVAAAVERIANNPDLASELARTGNERVRMMFHSGVSAEAVVRCLNGEFDYPRVGAGARAVEESISSGELVAELA